MSPYLNLLGFDFPSWLKNPKYCSMVYNFLSHPLPLIWQWLSRGPQQQHPSFFFSNTLKSFPPQDLCTYSPSPWIMLDLPVVSFLIAPLQRDFWLNVTIFYFPHSSGPLLLSFLPCSAHCANLANLYSCLFSALSHLAINATKPGTLYLLFPQSIPRCLEQCVAHSGSSVNVS